MTETNVTPTIIPWGPVGYVTYKRTYSRPTKNGKTEEWHETIEQNRVE